jgi:hypothetical protein
MATLKRILEAARLIESTDPAPSARDTGDADIDALIARVAAEPAAAPPPAEDAPVADAGAAGGLAQAGVEEGLAFPEIYTRQGVSEAAFPVERLLKLVEGLRALDAGTRRAAILAMDVADETWSMADVLADADAKVAALRAHQRQQQAAAEGVMRANQQRVSELETARDAQLAELRRQIAALEAQIQQAQGDTAAEVAKLHAETESNKAALNRETQRVDAHIANLADLTAQFRQSAG